jgi:hypothetical protein
MLYLSIANEMVAQMTIKSKKEGKYCGKTKRKAPGLINRKKVKISETVKTS